MAKLYFVCSIVPRLFVVQHFFPGERWGDEDKRRAGRPRNPRNHAATRNRSEGGLGLARAEAMATEREQAG
eukprot:7662128-Pyramimonas_sp.AAC.1